MAQMPCELLSALAAAEDYDIEVFALRHNYVISSIRSAWSLIWALGLCFPAC
jgi:hypothetical protein